MWPKKEGEYDGNSGEEEELGEEPRLRVLLILDGHAKGINPASTSYIHIYLLPLFHTRCSLLTVM
jgi:hypothetical protein